MRRSVQCVWQRLAFLGFLIGVAHIETTRCSNHAISTEGMYQPTVAAHTCSSACRNRYGDVVLVVMFNVAFPGWLEVHKQVSAAYKPLFRQIVYTGFHLQVACP